MKLEQDRLLKLQQIQSEKNLASERAALKRQVADRVPSVSKLRRQKGTPSQILSKV